MARVYEPDAAGLAEWQEFIDTLPPDGKAKASAMRFPPWELLLLRSSGHRVLPYSYADDGTLSVVVLGRYNLISFERRVFGIEPDDLEPCDLPAEGEVLGVTMSPQQQLDYINQQRKKNGLKPLMALKPENDE